MNPRNKIKLLDIIQNAATWNDIYIQLVKYNTGIDHSAGKLFEEFCKYYYLTEPSLNGEYKHIWLFSEIPSKVKVKLNLGKTDYGIDLVLEDFDGKLSVVQCKFKNDQNSKISWAKDKLTNFFADGDLADYLIIFTNASSIDKYSLSKKSKQLKIITSGDLLSLEKSTIDMIKCAILGKEKNIILKNPRDYQQNAINKVVDGLNRHDRGQIILPCGTGKTILSLWIMESLNISHTLVLVPSLAILRQTKSEWVANRKSYIPYICVCSEGDIDTDYDSPVTHLCEISGIVTTNPKGIKDFLHNKKNTITFSTYQSLPAIKEALKSSDFIYDLAICDEAHKTAGGDLKEFGLIHSNKNIPVIKRIYMTATPRVISSRARSNLTEEQLEYLYDMNDLKVFGPELYRMSYKEAIERNILVDYKIIAIGIDSKELHQAIKQRKFVSKDETMDEVANNYSLEYIMDKHNLTHAITFHSTIKLAKQFADRHHAMFHEIDVFHVNGKLTTNDRNKIMVEFEHSSKSVITNSRCLMEGINMPVIDTIYFCDPKYSNIDIVQATGRALRKDDYRNKTFGYIIVPIFHSAKSKLKKTINSSPFKNLINVVRALSSHDERIIDEINSVKIGKGIRSNNTTSTTSISSCKFISIEGFGLDLRNALFDQIIDRIQLPWRPFEESRSIIHDIHLKSRNEWTTFCKSGMKPLDIPRNPYVVYKNKGWISWGDWLGTGTISPRDMSFRPFEIARSFIHTLKLQNYASWQKYCKSGNKPIDIPSNPYGVYMNDGWISWGDWLGTGKVAPQNMSYLPFSNARKYIHSIGLKSSRKWSEYIKSGHKPSDIPANPRSVYKSEGWKSMGDWLGTENIAPQNMKFRSFEEARIYVQQLKLRNYADWKQYCKSGDKPNDIPFKPSRTYKDKGWKSLGDWLGTGNVSPRDMYFLPFNEAKDFVHLLKLKSSDDWKKYCKNTKKPDYIPANPRRVYKYKGWKSMGDWLGTGTIAPKDMLFRPFTEAQAFVHSLGLKSSNDWKTYCISGNKPHDLPSNPNLTYKGTGWTSMGDWLGTRTIANFERSFRPFHEAREFVRSLRLKGSTDWKRYCKSGMKPSDIPATPSRTYKNMGWVSMGDWFGTGIIATYNMKFRSFQEARKFVQSLGLKNRDDWKKYCKSGNKPNDIPNNPYGVYRNNGWNAWGDWLGTGTVAPQKHVFRSFENARNYVHQLNLKSVAEWKIYCRRGHKPYDIPADPYRTYKGKGWLSWRDWIGYK